MRDATTKWRVTEEAKEVKSIVLMYCNTTEKVKAAAQQFTRLAHGNMRKILRSVYAIAIKRTTYSQTVGILINIKVKA